MYGTVTKTVAQPQIPLTPTPKKKIVLVAKANPKISKCIVLEKLANAKLRK